MPGDVGEHHVTCVCFGYENGGNSSGDANGTPQLAKMMLTQAFGVLGMIRISPPPNLPLVTDRDLRFITKLTATTDLGHILVDGHSALR